MNRKLLRGWLVASSLALVSGVILDGYQRPVTTQTIGDRLVGGWRLISLEEPDAAGTLRQADCTGNLVFTRDGHMAVQVMYRTPQAANNAYAVGGYEATFGTFTIDEGTRTFTLHVEGGIVRSNIGKDLPRQFELSATRLVVRSTDPREHWRVTWEHY
jgi:hypothetical protein